MIKNLDKEKELAAKEAVKFIKNGQIVGLGTGSSAVYAIKEIGEMVKNGLQIKAIPTSNKTREMAESLHIPLIDINSVEAIDITIDGADEFDVDLVLLKGGGGALLREKIVASLTKEEIIIADSSKKVAIIGKFKVPLAVVPFAANYVLRQLKALNGRGTIRMIANKPFMSDEGNYIVDADFGLIENPPYLSDELNKIEGLMAHGIFINLASKVIMGNDDSTEIFER